MTEAWLGPRDVARRCGVSTDTLRHYERLGLLPVTPRTDAGYRRYPPSTVARVQVIQRALVIGFSLRDLASVFRQRDAADPPCRRVRVMVGERLETLNRQLAELTTLRDEMSALLRDWDVRLSRTPTGQRARLLDMLIGRAGFAVVPALAAGKGKRPVEG
jgi:DNA-binding transcriptional MerR regulator